MPSAPMFANVKERCVRTARSDATGTRLVYVALGIATAAIALLLLTVQWLTPAERGTLVVVALAAWALLVAVGWTRGSLPLKPVVGAIAVVMVLAVVTPSAQSKDVFSYSMYGRILTEHHHNPYNSYPMHFEGDPMRRHVSSVWQRTPDIYGPAFTAVMAVYAPIIGESTFLARFMYQLLAAAAATALLWVLWRRTRNPLVIAFLGLHPLTSVSVVNGGHPDVIIALAFVVAYFLALERRVVLCALALALGVAINFSVIVAPVALVVWAWRKWPHRDVVKLAAITLVLGALPYPFLHGWIKNAHEHQQLISRMAIWNPVAGFLTGTAPSFLRIKNSMLLNVMPNATTLLAGILLLVVLWRYTGRATPDVAMAGAISVFLVTSPWVMPWYAFAALPFFAMVKPTRLAWAVAIYSGLILTGDQFPSLGTTAVGTFTHFAFETMVPIIAFVACVIAIVRRPRDTASDEDNIDLRDTDDWALAAV